MAVVAIDIAAPIVCPSPTRRDASGLSLSLCSLDMRPLAVHPSKDMSGNDISRCLSLSTKYVTRCTFHMTKRRRALLQCSQRFADAMDAQVFETSAKTGTNVDLAVLALMREVLHHREYSAKETTFGGDRQTGGRYAVKHDTGYHAFILIPVACVVSC